MVRLIIKDIHIPDFTEFELDIFRDLCNFSSEERQCFEYMTKGQPHEYIAQHMYISTSKVSRLSDKVKRKVLRVIVIIHDKNLINF